MGSGGFRRERRARIVGTNTEKAAKLRFWMLLTEGERLWIGGILAIFLIGVAARWWHLRHESPEPYVPAGTEELR